MSDRIELVRRSNALFNQGDVEGWAGLLHPDIRLVDLLNAPDLPQEVNGIDQARRVVDEWRGALENLRADIEEYEDIEECVLCVTRWSGSGRGSGLEIDQRTVDIVEIEDGLIREIRTGYPDKAAAVASIRTAERR